MKKLIIAIALLLFANASYSQYSLNKLYCDPITLSQSKIFIPQRTLNYKFSSICKPDFDRNIFVNKFANNDTDYYRSRVTSGIGFTYLSNSNEHVRFLFSLYTFLNLKFITKYLYLGLGTDVFPEPKYALTTRITLNLIPTLGINLFNNKISAFIGGGFCYYAALLSGSILLFKVDYNINRNFSIGVDIKHTYFGDEELRDQTLLLNNINVSLRF